MNIENILTTLKNTPSDKDVIITFQSEPKPKAEFKGTRLKKITTRAFRAGLDYAELSTVKEAIANGERGEVQSLPWGEWVSYPYHIQHKGKDYVRLYSSPESDIEPKVQYFIEDQEVASEDFYSKLTPSSINSKTKDCFTLAAENILSI